MANTYLLQARIEYFATCRLRGHRSGDVTKTFIPIRCAIRLRHFGWLRAVYVATRINLLSSTAKGSATSGYVDATCHHGQSEACASKSGLNRHNSITKHVIMIFHDYVSTFYLILVHFPILSSYGKSYWSFVYVIIYCVGAGIFTLISISDWSDPFIFCPKMEKTRSVKEEMEGNVFISRQSRHIFFVTIMIKVLFPTLYLYLACKQICFPPSKRYK